MPDAPDIKPRSRTVTDGIEALTSRGMLRAVGMGDADWDTPDAWLTGIVPTGTDTVLMDLAAGVIATGGRHLVIAIVRGLGGDGVGQGEDGSIRVSAGESSPSTPSETVLKRIRFILVPYRIGLMKCLTTPGRQDCPCIRNE